jgi:predicted transcriptional regulator
VLYDQQDKTVQEIADDLSISRATAYRFLKIANSLEKDNPIKIKA